MPGMARKLITRLLCGSIALTMAGCASQTRIALSDADRATSQGSSVVVIVTQNQLNKEFDPSAVGAATAGAVAGIPGLGILLAAAAGGVGGAIDAKVNADRAQQAEQDVLPLRLVLTDFSFDDRAKLELDGELTSLESLQSLPSVISKDPATRLDASSTQSPQLNIAMFYSVSKDFSALNVRALAQQMPKVPAPTATKKARAGSGSATKSPRPVYRNTILFTARLPAIDGQTDAQRIEIWQRSSGNPLIARSMLDAVDAVARHLARDIAQSPETVKSQLADRVLEPYRATPKGPVLGKVLERSGGQTLVRMNDGSLNIVVTL